jgi:hypothetical protein
MVGCSKGFDGCPGKVPLTSKQCKSHRIYARVKAKMEAALGEGVENSWIRAVDITKNLRQSKCLKECCSMGWLPSQQVTYILLDVNIEIFNLNFRLTL